MITYGSTTLTSYNTITKIEVYYYKSTSSTDLAGGSWSTTKPTWENGKYIWQKIRTTYEGKLANGQFYSESDPVNITGQQGATGTAAYSYKLNASDTIVGRTKTGQYTVNEITFTATYKQGTGAVTAYAGRFKIETTLNGTDWITAVSSTANESSKNFTIPENIIAIKCSLYQAGGLTVLLDIMTVPIVKDGVDAIGLRNTIPYYLASDKDTGVTRDEVGWSRYTPQLTADKKYLWVYYASRYSEGNSEPELIDIKDDVVSFVNNGEISPSEGCVVDINPIQDCNGYDKPWIAGGGVNKFDIDNIETVVGAYGLTTSIDGDVVKILGTYTGTGASSYRIIRHDQPIIKNAKFAVFRLDTSSILISCRYASTSDNSIVVEMSNVTPNTDVDVRFRFMIYTGSTAPATYSPYSNICPITGWTEAKVTRCGKNLWSFNSSYSPTAYAVLLNRVPFYLKAGTYTFSAIPNIESDNIVLFGYHADGTRTEFGRLPASTSKRSATSTISKDVVSLYFVSNRGGTISDIQLELGSTATAYEPYKKQDYIYDVRFDDNLSLIKTDNEPYQFRQNIVPTAFQVDRFEDEIVGGSVVWNQLQGNKVNKTSNGVTFTYNETTGELTIDGTAENNAWWLTSSDIRHDFCKDHIYLIDIGNENYSYVASQPYWYFPDVFSSSIIFSSATIKKCAVSTKSYSQFLVPKEKEIHATYVPQFFDLTQMFGTEIANYLYNLEQNEAGAGVAWFRKYFPNEYYEYNAGEIKSVEELQSHDMVGFNLFDKDKISNGYLNTETGILEPNTAYYTTDYIPVLKNQIVKIPATGSNRRWFYDINKNPKKYLNSSNTQLFNPSENGYIRVSVSRSIISENDLCINLSRDGNRNGKYEPYINHSYPLDSSLILRGIPKLSSEGNLYYDGDRYKSDGTVTRKYGIVDLGTLNWAYQESFVRFTATTSLPQKALSTSANLICTKYEGNIKAYTDADRTDKIICTSSNGNGLLVRDSSYTDATSFKTAMSGVYLVYELATPITEKGAPYQSLQAIDPYGTEEYVTNSIIPVGHETKYYSRAVYGGQLDMTNGILTVDRARLTLTGDSTKEAWYLYAPDNYNADCFNIIIPNKKIGDSTSICDKFSNIITCWGANGDNKYGVYSDHPTLNRFYFRQPNANVTTVDEWKEWLSENPVTVCYELADPIIYQLTPQELTMLTGQNYIYSDSGQTNIRYYDNQTSTEPRIDYTFMSAYDTAQMINNAVGTLEAPYTEVEWVESTGKQYVYLDWKPPIKTWGFEADFICRNSISTTGGNVWNEETNADGYGTIFGTRNASAINDCILTSYATGYIKIGGGSISDIGFERNKRIVMKMHDTTFTKPDGTTKTLTRLNETANKPYWNMTVFAYHQGLRQACYGGVTEPSSTRIYSLKFFDGDTLTVDLVGAIRKSDRITGLYDKVSKHFYPAPGLLYGNEVGDIGEIASIKQSMLKTNPQTIVVNKNRTRMWEATVPFDHLEDGQKLTVTYSYGNVVNSVETEKLAGWTDTSSNQQIYLKLTLSNGNQTDWIPCYYSNTGRLTTHYGSGIPIVFTYRENMLAGASETSSGYAVMRGFYADANYDSNTIYTQYASAVKAGTNGVKRYTLIMRDSDNTYSSFINQANTLGTTKTAYTGGFVLGKIYYSSGGAEYATGANTSSIWSTYQVDLRYDFNITTSGATALTLYKPVYLVGTVHDDDGLFYLDTTQWWTQTEPTSEDGKVYIFIGQAYSAYQSWLAVDNTAYQYYDGKFMPYETVRTLKSITTLQETLENQIDGKVETWCQINNPATAWTTVDLKNQHDGDLWYYIGESNTTYKNNTTYKYTASTGKWTAYSASTDLFDRIDSKSTVYYGKPSAITQNLEVGDYLVDNTDGCSYRWDGSKWIKLTDYKTAIDNIEIGGRNLFINKNAVPGYITGTGAVNPQSSTFKECTSDFIPVKTGETYILQTWVSEIKDTNYQAWLAYAFYTDNTGASGTMVGFRTAKYSQQGETFLAYNNIAVPSTASYLRVSYREYENGLVKLEKGNKPTNWSPAPEDVEFSMDEKIDNIEIGGRNLLLNSAIEKTGASDTAQWMQWTISDSPLIANEDYIFSFDAKMSNNADVFYIGFALNSSTQEVMKQNVSVTNEYKRYAYKVKTVKTNINSIIISNTKSYGKGNENNTTGVLSVKNVKLEKGNKATKWTPAPEDIETELTTIKNNLQSQIDEKIQTYYQSNNPASAWTTTALRTAHDGDLWYYTGTTTATYTKDNVYRYNGSNNTWTTYSASGELFDKVDGKSTIYYGTTSGTYTGVEIGDYLIDANDGSSYRYDGSTWVKVTDYKSAIDNIEIGGRNLARNTKGAIIDKTKSAEGSRAEYAAFDLGCALPLNDNDNISISFDLYMVVRTAKPILNVYNTNNQGVHQTCAHTDVLSGNSYQVGDVIDKRIAFVSTIHDRESSTLPHDYLEFYSIYGTNNFFRISNLKVEKGNMPTDWTPAPEDTENAIQSAQSKADEALTSANNKNKIYYSTSAPTGGTYIDGDTWFDTDDDNSVHIYNGSTKKWVKQQLGENAIADASISNAKIANATIQSAKIANLDGAKIVANTITANKLATDAIKSNNYSASSNTSSPYSAAGTFLDLATGNIYTPNFGVDSVNGGAYINGQVVASTGQIGDSAINYWQIGSHIDYNMNPSAAIIGHGTSFIQSGQWQISNNRINTQTYDDQNKITYLHHNSKYWDYGMQVPELDTTKSTYIDGVSNNWLYIRRSTADSIPALENNWEYLFRVDKDGTVYENGVKLSEKYASIDGVSGAYLPRTGGTITGNLTVNGTLTATASKANALTHTLSINGQSWSGSANLTINTLGVAYGGTGKTTGKDAANYFLNSLDTGSSTPVDGDYYISQYVSGGTTTTTYHRRPMSALWLYVKSKLSAADIYVPKTGGTFTGAVTMSDVLNADSITAGDLLVNGAARFNNGLRATNINGGQAIYTVIGTQTATTAAWTGELPINELYDGLTIAYYLPRTSANNVTLKLTLANGEETAAIPVYVTSTTRMTTHYGAGSTILLTYWSKGSVSVNGTATTEDRWTHGDYWDGNTIGEYGGSCIAGEHGMARYSLIIQTGHDVWESLVTTSTTATTKAKNSSGFLITSPILYQNGNTYVKGGIAGYSSCWSTGQNIDTRYSFNVSDTWSSNGRSLYLVGTISGDKFTLKDTTWWADELPETNDGYYYWYIGQMASAYTYTLHPVHPIYYYDDGIKVLNVGALTSSQVTNALGYTPYNATNPNGYTTNKGTVTSVRVQASAPLQSSTSTAQGTTLDTTISFVNQNKNLVLASPSSGSAGAPTFRSLVSDDIPSLAWSKITSGNDDLKAIEALTGTSGFLKKTAANTWSLDTNTYLTTHQTVTDKNTTLAWGAATTVATIGSTDIKVSLPSNPNNHYTANLITGASNSAKANAAATNGNVFLNLIENSTVRNYHNLKGGNGLTVTSDANGVVTFTSPAAFTGVSFGDGKLTFTKSDGNTAEILTDDFVITQATGATGLVNSSGQGLSVGGATTKPVYFKNGVPTEITSIPYTLLTGAPTSMTPTAHTHGNIQNGGTLQTSDITVGNGDKIVVTDSSNSHKVARSSIAFDGSTKTQALTKAGTWETFNNYSLPLAASGTRGGVKIGYTSSGKNYAVQLNDEKMYVNVPWIDTTYSAGTGLSLSGTTFNHSNSVTADTVGSTVATSSADRTITIPYVTYDAQGHITKTGTHTHTIENYPEAYLSWGGKNFAGNYGCIDAAMIPELGANRFAFLRAAGIEIEYSKDNGETWIDYEATDATKTGLFGTGVNIYLGKATNKADNIIENQLRVTITTNLASLYTVLNKIAIYMSTQGNTTFVKMEKAPQSAPTDYTTHLDWTQISGWSGWNILNINGITTYGNTASQYQKIRFIFKQTAINANYGSAMIARIMGFGGVGWTVPSNMAKNGHLYTYDNSQNAAFPAKVTATTFIGALSGNATSATSADSATKATQDSDGHQINTTYLKLAGGTMTGVLAAKANQYTDSYSGALNMNNSNIYGVNGIYTADSSEDAREGIHFYRSATTVDSLHAKAGVLYFTPNRTLGQVGTSYTVYHTGNKPSKSDVGLGNVDNTADANKVVKGVSAAAGTSNTYRHVWFSDSATETSRNNDADFTYNPNTNDLKVPSVTGITMNLSNWKIEQDSSTESLMFRYVG